MSEPQFPDIRAAFLGDSITVGTYTGIHDEYPASRAREPFCIQVSRRLGFLSAENFAMNGISFSSTSPVNSEEALCRRYRLLPPDADLVIIAAGTNDHGTDVPLGDPADREDISFRGALRILCEGLKDRCPGARVVFLTPIDKLPSGKNKAGFTLQDYRDAIEAAAGICGYPVLRGNEIPLSAGDTSIIRDGCHPNEEGHAVIADFIVPRLARILSAASETPLP